MNAAVTLHRSSPGREAPVLTSFGGQADTDLDNFRVKNNRHFSVHVRQCRKATIYPPKNLKVEPTDVDLDIWSMNNKSESRYLMLRIT